jgi:hypothetical protein
VKLLIEIEAPGIERLTATQSDHEEDVPKEVAAFVSALVKSRLRCPAPKVTVLNVGSGAVLVDTGALLRLQEKASALQVLVECSDREIPAALKRATDLVKA